MMIVCVTTFLHWEGGPYTEYLGKFLFLFFNTIRLKLAGACDVLICLLYALPC